MADHEDDAGSRRYDFASDYDGDLCLIAPASTQDWRDWRVYEVAGDGTRKESKASPGGFCGYVHLDAKASWYIPEFAHHVEMLIPGEEVITFHPSPGPFNAPARCPVCGYKGKRRVRP
jgi:hypothetical protein